MLKKIILIFCATSLLNFYTLLASDQVGTIVKLKGDVQVYSNPSDKVTIDGPNVLYEGKYYLLSKGKLGFKIPNGSIVLTGKDSQTRIVFINGDQYNVDEATAYKVNWAYDPKTKQESSATINLLRGKLRAVVSKEGPRNNLKIETRNASMGVRGTDFFVAKAGNIGETKVSVLRGEVALKVKKDLPVSATVEQKKEQFEEIKVRPGFTANVQTPKVDEVVPQKISLDQTNKDELVSIQKASVIEVKAEEQSTVTSKETETITKELEALEKKAVETTMNDIKTYDPKLYESIKKENIQNIAMINSQVVKQGFDKAPEGPKKPKWKDIDNLDQKKIYDNFFSVEEN